MKTLINILCVSLTITFASVEVQANIFNTLLKGAKIASKAGEQAGKLYLQSGPLLKQTQKVFEFVESNTFDKNSCLFHNKNINDKKYFNSLLEQIPKEDNKNSDSDESLSSDTKELKLDDKIDSKNEHNALNKLKRPAKIGCKWEKARCSCFQKKRLLKEVEVLKK